MESWLGLRFTSAAIYMDLLRECYEAFVIYSFYQLLVTYLGGEKQLVATLAKKESHPHVFPFCCLPQWRMSDRFQIQFSDAEMQSLQQALQQSSAASAQTDEELGAAAATARRERPPSPSVGRRNSVNGESKESGSDRSTSSAAASSSGVGSNPSPDYSAAASSPDLIRPAGAPVERPVFSAHPPVIPSTYLSPFSRPHHSDFLTHTQLGTLQYTVCKPLTALLAFILSMLDLYGDSSFEWNRGYPYLAFITNMSQIWAMCQCNTQTQTDGAADAAKGRGRSTATHSFTLHQHCSPRTLSAVVTLPLPLPFPFLSFRLPGSILHVLQE